MAKVLISERELARIMKVVRAVEMKPINTVPHRRGNKPLGGSGASASLYIAKIKTRVSDDHYTCDIYENGKHNTPTELAKILRILEVAAGAAIAVNHFVLVSKQTWEHPITGVEEVEYTYDVPRNL